MTTTKPVSAATVSRVLQAAGMHKSETFKARICNGRTAGYEIHAPKGGPVTVDYCFDTFGYVKDEHLKLAERRARMLEALRAAGIDAELVEGRWHTTIRCTTVTR